ncbi:hypothetical protein ACR820_05355 [Streptomyces netropsis]
MAAPRKIPLELRERAVRMYCTSAPKPQFKRFVVDLDVHPQALRGWIWQAEADRGERGDRLTTAEKEGGLSTELLQLGHSLGRSQAPDLSVQ